MKRFWLVPVLALAGLAASPSNASAHFLLRFCQPCDGGFVYGYGRWGVPYYQPYFVPQYYVVPQYYSVPLAPPMIVPHSPNIPLARPTGIPCSDAAPRSAPMVTITPGMAEPEPLIKPATGNVAVPMPAPAPMAPLTIPDPMVPKAPPMVVPPPPIVLPETPAAKPMPAPASPDNLPLIPLPEPRKVPKEIGDKDDLPPIVLPPEGTGTSSGVIPPVTTKSSPLAGAIKVQIFSAAGSAKGALRKVGFFNQTDRDLDLVIEGKPVKLPKKSYLNAELPVKFNWKAAGNEGNATTVPEGAAGVDVLFKE